MSAMNKAWVLLKEMRQSNLGEHEDFFPSPYGPVVAYHGTTGDNFTDIMAGSGLQNPDPYYAHITTNPSEAATYALQRSGDARNTPMHQSQPKLVAIRQAAFDQNHANYIGPSHGLKNKDDYKGAQHFGGNIPRQFLTNTSMSNNILGDTMQARDNRQDIIDRNMAYPAQSENKIRRVNAERRAQEERANQPVIDRSRRKRWSRSK
jgi:hypothetical protein